MPSVVNDDHPVVDLGCGRGEWMGALQSRGIPVRGVDSNVVCVAECTDKNLHVELSDIVDYLHGQPDQSVGTFTMFQVLEHLPFPVLLDTLRQIRRVLVPGGRLIAEVPNAKNLRVAAGTFWIDPTHQRPLYPELLLFLAEELGFSSTEGIYVNDLSPKFDLSGLSDGPREALQRLLDAVDTAGDFALIATA
ncbi:MAG: class I SAM-dependent methyltransferase [Actinomycetota bacterium]